MSSRSENDTRLRMMAALDGELEAAELRDLERQIAAEPQLAAEWQRLRHLQELTQMTTIKNPPDEQWDQYRHSVLHRVERGIGWLMVSIGATVLLSYGLWEAIQEVLGDSSIPGFIKAAIFTLGAGGLVLFVSVVREKLFTRKNDRFKEVQR